MVYHVEVARGDCRAPCRILSLRRICGKPLEGEHGVYDFMLFFGDRKLGWNKGRSRLLRSMIRAGRIKG